MAARHFFSSAAPVEPGDDELLTIAELCAVLRISRAQFYVLRQRRRLPVREIWVGDQVRFRRGDVRAFVRHGIAIQHEGSLRRAG